MTPAEIGVVMFTLGVLVGIPAGYAWCRHEEREDRQRARDDKQVLCDAITRLEGEVAALLSPVIPRQRYRLFCPECGQVEVATDVVPVPATDDEYALALDVILTEHCIAAHLDAVTG